MSSPKRKDNPEKQNDWNLSHLTMCIRKQVLQVLHSDVNPRPSAYNLDYRSQELGKACLLTSIWSTLTMLQTE